MERIYHVRNRERLYAVLPDHAVVVLFGGEAVHQSADANYFPFFTNRNFLYFTGIEGNQAENLLFLAHKIAGGVSEILYLLPPDERAERWDGPRLKADMATEYSGIQTVSLVPGFEEDLHKILNQNPKADLWLSLEKQKPAQTDDAEHRFAEKMSARYPQLRIQTLIPITRQLRTIKSQGEIQSMREAMKVTRAGILAMMEKAEPGMYEYELKAEYDYVLTKNAVLTPGFPSIICAGENNFCIHYYEYKGLIKDGDLILNDVGAQIDGITNDVSRGWPVNGRFSEKQRLLYQCAYETSEYMFSIVKPGMPMASVDETARKYCFGRLKAIGLLDRYEDIGRYIWHGGAHHVGYDVHDPVDYRMDVSPGMVFCIDIGIYCLEWGIGFRLEDNCLVTEDGCENLSKDIPRGMDEIETTIAELRR